MYDFLSFWWWTKFVKEYKQIRKLRSLKYTHKEWAGRIIEPPNKESLVIAERILNILHKRDLHPDRIISSGEGGVAFCWLPSELPAYAAIEITNDDELLMLSIIKPDSDHFEEFSEDDLDLALDKVYEFIITI